MASGVGGCAVALGAVESQSLFGGTFVKLMVFGPGCARMAPRVLKFDAGVQNSMLVMCITVHLVDLMYTLKLKSLST